MAVEYSSLTKTQKLAAFFIALGPETAGRMMKDFPDADIEVICREIAQMPVLEARVQNEVLREFAHVVVNGVRSALGGVQFAQTMLCQSKDEYEASAIMNRCAITTTSAGPVEVIRQMESRQLLNIAKNEQPQTIAFIVSCLEPKKAADLVSNLPAELREEVVERLGSMDGASEEVISKVAKNLNRHVDRRAPQPNIQRSGGVRACVEILNALKKDLRKTLIARLEERDAELGAEIRKQSFCFEDLDRLTPADLQRVLREVDSATLPLALKGVKPEVVTAVLGAMSKRAAQSVRDEIEQLGPKKLKDVEAAQESVIKIVRKLEENEEITLDAAGEDNVLV
jgi:flagellar motor switch protein FliG